MTSNNGSDPPKIKREENEQSLANKEHETKEQGSKQQTGNPRKPRRNKRNQ